MFLDREESAIVDYLCMLKAKCIRCMAAKRKYPVGIQTFSRLIREGYVYVDKTDLVWELAQENNLYWYQ